MSRVCAQCLLTFAPQGGELLCPRCVAVPDGDGQPERRGGRGPSPKQVYLMAHLALERLGIEWPTNRGAVQDVVDELRKGRS